MTTLFGRIEKTVSEGVSDKIAAKVAEVYRQIRDPDLYPGEAAWLCIAKGVCGTIDTVVGCPPPHAGERPDLHIHNPSQGGVEASGPEVEHDVRLRERERDADEGGYPKA